MDIQVIKQGQSLIEEAGGILLSARSLPDNIVVFPGKRPAHFLRRLLAEKKGEAFRAPVMTSMDGFVDLAAARLGILGTEAPALDLAEVLYRHLKPELCGLISQDSKELPLEAFLPWALKLIGDFEELKVEGKSAGDLVSYDDILREDLRTPLVEKKLENFSRLYSLFYERLGEAGLLTRSMKYAAVAERIGELDLGGYENILFAGFFALTASEKKIIRGLSGRGALLLLEPGPGLSEEFGLKAGSAEARQADLSRVPEKLRFYKAPDIHGEVFSLARELKDAGPGDVIALPDARTLFPLLENVLPGAGEYNVSMGYPLSATPLYALLDALGDLLDKRNGDAYFVPNYLRFVFHPYVKNLRIGRSAEAGRIIFQALEERLSGLADKYASLAGIEADGEMRDTAAERLKEPEGGIAPGEVGEHLAAVHSALIKPFEDVRDIGDFASKLLDLISYVSEKSTAPEHPYWAPFAQKAIEQITELRNCRLSGEHFRSAAGYFKFLKVSLQGAGYPFPGTPLKGLQVLGLLETRGLKFRRVYFMDANADILPASRKEDTVLPHHVRESLKLSTYRTRERLSRYYFSALLGGAEEAHIFYKDSADKERSPFVEKLAWDLELSKRKPEESRVHMRVSFSQGVPAGVNKNAELLAALKEREYSPSAIDTYLSCGLRFYYRYGLGLAEKDEISGEVEQRDIGQVVHEVLEDFFGEKAGRPLNILEKDYGAVKAAAARVFDERLKGHASGAEYLIKRQVEKRLADILDYHRDNLAGIEILACETKLKACVRTKMGEVKLRGFADRVDRRGGVIHIVDYKTGSAAAVPAWHCFDPASPLSEWPKTLKSVQLPFYMMAYMQANGMDDAGRMDASLLLLGPENIVEERLFRERKGHALDRKAEFARLSGAITRLIEDILDPEKPFSPAADEAECSGCPFRTMCGRQWVE